MTRATPWFLLACIPFALLSCQRSNDDGPTVVLYSSVDRFVLDEVIASFEESTGIKVLLATDTEATKTTGLVVRLLAERDRPRADVWWSSEPFGTIRLAGEGIFEPYHSPQADLAFPDGWPTRLRSSDNLWYAFAQRARVLAFAPDRVSAAEAPTTLRELVDPKWSNRIGMARPAFGTTRGHMASLVEHWGPDDFEAWLTAMHSNGLRLYNSNSEVVRAIARAEIDAGLTDTDDVFTAQAAGMNIDLRYELKDAAPTRWPSPGPLVIPNTVALVAGAPNPTSARSLIDYLLSPEVERILAQSDSRNAPVNPLLAAEFPTLAVPTPASASLQDIAAAVPDAMLICQQVLGP